MPVSATEPPGLLVMTELEKRAFCAHVTRVGNRPTESLHRAVLACAMLVN